MVQDDEDRQRMREFIVLWRLRQGPLTEDELAVASGLEPGSAEARVQDIVVRGLFEKGLVAQDPEGGRWELTATGRDMVDAAPAGFTDGFMELMDGCGPGTEEE